MKGTEYKKELCKLLKSIGSVEEGKVFGYHWELETKFGKLLFTSEYVESLKLGHFCSRFEGMKNIEEFSEKVTQVSKLNPYSRELPIHNKLMNGLQGS